MLFLTPHPTTAFTAEPPGQPKSKPGAAVNGVAASPPPCAQLHPCSLPRLPGRGSRTHRLPGWCVLSPPPTCGHREVPRPRCKTRGEADRSQPSTLVDDDREVGVGSRDLGQRAPHLCLWTTVLHPICSTATSYMQPSRVPLGSTTLPSGCSVPLPPVSRSSHRVCLSSCLTWTVLSHPHNIPEGGGATST